jgi:hypothetical protein
MEMPFDCKSQYAVVSLPTNDAFWQLCFLMLVFRKRFLRRFPARSLQKLQAGCTKIPAFFLFCSKTNILPLKPPWHIPCCLQVVTVRHCGLVNFAKE